MQILTLLIDWMQNVLTKVSSNDKPLLVVYNTDSNSRQASSVLRSFGNVCVQMNARLINRIYLRIFCFVRPWPTTREHSTFHYWNRSVTHSIKSLQMIQSDCNFVQSFHIEHMDTECIDNLIKTVGEFTFTTNITK